ncbi:ABC transporter substrate-binding protein [bacterium]|nr:ABC transporter substrate-binding protein [bacterium]
MRRSAAVFLVVLISILRCGKPSDQAADGRVTVVFWHSFVSSTIPALNDLIVQFENAHPGIDIKTQYVPTGDALIQKLITAVQSKTAPDISWVHANYIESLVEADAIYPMSRFIQGRNGLNAGDLADIYPALLQYASWKDTLYSMPMEATNLALLYNKTLFSQAGLDPAKPPQNWDELHGFAKKMTVDSNGDGKFDQVGFFLPVFPAAGPNGPWMVWQWFPYLWQAGGAYINDPQTEVLYNGPGGRAALALWRNLYRDLRLNAFTTDYDVAFASGRLAMVMDGPWNLPRFERLLANVDWAVAPLPAGPDRRATIVGGEYLTIFKQSANPDSAWAFLKWIIRPDVQAKWAIKSGYLPVRRAVLNDPEFQVYIQANPKYRAFVEQMEFGESQKPIDRFGLEIDRHIAEAIENACLGQKDVAEALEESAQKSNRLLQSPVGE